MIATLKLGRNLGHDLEEELDRVFHFQVRPDLLDDRLEPVELLLHQKVAEVVGKFLFRQTLVEVVALILDRLVDEVQQLKGDWLCEKLI